VKKRRTRLNGCEAKFAEAEKAMDLMLERLEKLNKRLREKPPKSVNTHDLPEVLPFPLMAAEK